ncbi:NfeD family protein [Nesterenkonia alba]|uniref:NfeD family protein n=1 Tax=Nesterenkonia alba TaxID=515814 RepID=UPI0003B671BB|nr:NfeD family protein [Nesterenkonia alba]
MIEWFGENLWAAWLSLAFILLVLEVFSLDLLFIMLAAGSVAAMTVALAGGAWWLQIIIGCVVALLMIGAVRPIALKHLKKGPEDQLTNVDRLTGTEAQAIETVTATEGLAEVDGDTWSARAAGNYTIEAGTHAVVESIDGAIVYLKPAPSIEWNDPQTRQA